MKITVIKKATSKKPNGYCTSYIDDGLLILRLNRPHNMNAFTVEMSAELVDAYAQASADDRVKAIVVTGAGEAFCAGMDLSTEGNVFGIFQVDASAK